jgi:hypothetical protein
MSRVYLLGVVVAVGCASVPNARLAPAASPPLDLSPFRRIWVAGFLTSETRDIDVNDETVRLLRRRLNPRTPLRVIETAPLAIRHEDELSDAEHWRRRAEEYGEPLIVTGSVKLSEARPVALERTPSRAGAYTLRKGFVLDATFVFIDGRTGSVIGSERAPQEKAYGADQRASTLSLYFELMDRVVPAVLRRLGP